MFGQTSLCCSEKCWWIQKLFPVWLTRCQTRRWVTRVESTGIPVPLPLKSAGVLPSTSVGAASGLRWVTAWSYSKCFASRWKGAGFLTAAPLQGDLIHSHLFPLLDAASEVSSSVSLWLKATCWSKCRFCYLCTLINILLRQMQNSVSRGRSRLSVEGHAGMEAGIFPPCPGQARWLPYAVREVGILRKSKGLAHRSCGVQSVAAALPLQHCLLTRH